MDVLLRAADRKSRFQSISPHPHRLRAPAPCRAGIHHLQLSLSPAYHRQLREEDRVTFQISRVLSQDNAHIKRSTNCESRDDGRCHTNSVGCLCQAPLPRFTERRSGGTSDTDGQPARASKRERASQTPYKWAPYGAMRSVSVSVWKSVCSRNWDHGLSFLVVCATPFFSPVAKSSHEL